MDGVLAARVTLTAVRSAHPGMGSTMKVDVGNLPVAVPVFLVLAGTSRIQPGLDLGFAGAPGCTLDNDMIVTEIVPAAFGAGRWSLPIPIDPAWLGRSIFRQAVGIDAAANALGPTSSNLGEASVGS